MRPHLALLATLLFTLGCRAQNHPLPDTTAKPGEFSANLIIPDPPPSAALSQWREAEGRTLYSLQAGTATLRGFRYTGADPKAPILLFFNGNGMTVVGADSLYRQLATLGPTVVAVDYRGYGFSTGAPDLLTYRADALSLYDRLAANNQRVLVYGFSMGTAIASYIASQRPVAALILAAPIASAEEEFPVYGHAAGFTDAQLKASPSTAAKQIFSEAEMIAHSQAPLLVLHGTADTLVPMNQGREIFAASPSTNKRFVPLPGTTHNGTASEPASFAAVTQLLHQLH
jgi:uncharacterized protein